MCGLCLPHCPTYRLELNEAESPRGRINGMRVLLEAETGLSPAPMQHLDNCLNCLACEAMCPSRVPYGELIDHARARLVSDHALKRPLSARIINSLATSGSGLRWLKFGARIAPWAEGALKMTGLGARLKLDAAIEAIPPAPDEFHSPASNLSPDSSNKKVSLLTGCGDRLWSGSTLNSAITLLQACGYQVEIPEGQGCCGALDLHEGQPEQAQQRVSTNESAFGETQVVSVATACSAHLIEHSSLKAADIIDFLLQDTGFLSLDFAPCSGPVAIHTPCSQKNSLGSASHNEKILRQIPGIELLQLDDNHGCCGAAGTHFLRNPQVAQSLRTPIIEEAREHSAAVLVSANIGCRLHLASGLRDSGPELEPKLEVIHPVTLLARQLRPPTQLDGNSP